MWLDIRKKIWLRDNGVCTHCNCKVDLDKCNIDHVVSGKYGTNSMCNLRTLCRKCHALRLDKRHRGMISKALKEDIIPSNWRELTWE